MKTRMLSKRTAQRNWVVMDVKDKVLGRAATQIASMLRGKHKPTFTPHADTGDFVVVVNAEKIKVTGNKLDDKMYYAYSGYPGGLRETPLRTMLAKHPDRVITRAVKGMLPDNRMSHKLMGKLKVYRGNNHPHHAQNPKIWKAK